ncbi:hypothetical protein H4R34_003506 [Dimargaris verticillata]|uniref:MAGE domain-containing protein n=1 Tax=Dimargaris verticillata TaxID=2761393 RepID=A0A9W8B6R5_9FUNG|nr:hypothetical protein H4R34_003506 [Dimargaris verticillata]
MDELHGFSASQRAVDQVTEEKAIELVRYALFCEYRKTSIKREDFNKKLLTDNPRGFNSVLAKANGLLQHIFGLTITELPAREKSAYSSSQANRRVVQGKESRTTSKYGLVVTNLLQPDCALDDEPALEWGSQLGSLGTTATILSIIFLNNMSLTSEQLRYHLLKLDLLNGPTDAEERVSALPLVRQLVRQGYLEQQVIGHAEGLSQAATQGASDNPVQQHEYRWGPRAKVEFPPNRMAAFIAHITGEPVTPSLLRQLEQASGLQFPTDS